MAGTSGKFAGKFIVLDGPDGAGKSTQLKLLAEHLAQQGASVCLTRDPGGTAIGDRIRKILLDNAHDDMSPQCEMMLYMASRAQLAAQVIRPALSAGQCVLCDRYVSSTIAYQGAAGVDVQAIRQAAQVAVAQTWPDLTVILNLPAEEGLQRLKGAPDRMESKALAFHRKVRELFLRQAAEAPTSFAVIDAAGTIQQVQQRLRQAVDSWEFRKR